ncbi:FG-GAP and VCBS repeat-containing protein [Streptomyces fractus]|uniref:FG-GAP and VCBS repeat-containing protein n=1 Tax=Streptomyces fractus TaxID=641806 RepID=UPI003CEB0A19
MPRSAHGRRTAASALACAAALLLASCSGNGEEEAEARHNRPGSCALAPEASPTPAVADGDARKRSVSGAADDFDGDGHADLLLNGWFKKRGSPWAPNRALVLGSANGVASGGRVSLTDRFPDIDGKQIGNPGTQGGAVRPLTGDFDGDRRTDILYVIERDKRNGELDHYEEQFIWGGKGGVDGSRKRLTVRREPYFAKGDFDGDGAIDLVAGPYHATRDKKNKVRCVALEFGPFDRDGRPKERRYVDITQHGRVYTESFTPGDFDGDGRDEFVTTGYRAGGATEEGWPKVYADASYYRVGADRATVRAGGLRALGHGAPVPYNPEGDEAQNEPSLAPHDSLATMATADFGGNGRVDLIHERELFYQGGDEDKDEVVYGGPAGPGTGRASTPLPEDRDNSATGDVNGDGRDDLVTSAYRSRVYQVGLVSVYLGGPHGLAAKPAHTLDREAVGMPGTAEHDYERDYFGTDLALADLNGDGSSELAVATQDFGVAPYEGVYWLVPGSRGGPVAGKAVRMDAWSIGRG